jgi:N-acetylglutamate synthase-like GNAT family acetyltransferase
MGNQIRERIRGAAPADLDALHELLDSVKLPKAGVSDHLHNFLVLGREAEIVGCVGLELYGSKALLRSLAISKSLQRSGLGSLLYGSAIEHAKKHRIDEVYLLTETAEAFFAARGFEVISRDLVDNAVKNSIEFRSACPQTATCMSLTLH